MSSENTMQSGLRSMRQELGCSDTCGRERGQRRGGGLQSVASDRGGRAAWQRSSAQPHMLLDGLELSRVDNHRLVRVASHRTCRPVASTR
jgi:hypothetical protein